MRLLNTCNGLAGERSTAEEKDDVPSQEELPGQPDSFELSQVMPLLERVLRDMVRIHREGEAHPLF